MLFQNSLKPLFLFLATLGFWPGSVIVDSNIVFQNNTEAPSTDAIVRALYNNIYTTNMHLGNFSLDVESIQSNTSTTDLLKPVAVKISFIIQKIFISSLQNSSSNEYSTLQNQTVIWLTPALTASYGQSLQENPDISFSNGDQWVSVSANYKLKAPSSVRNKSVANSLARWNSTSILVWRSTISVNGIKPDLVLFNVRMRITNRDFTDSLQNKSSQESEYLRGNLTEGLGTILRGTPQFAEIVVDTFQPGSVIANANPTYFEGGPSEAEVCQTIVNNLNELQNRGLSVEPSSIIIAPSTTTVPPVPQLESSFPGYAVAIIVMCSLLILAILILIILALKTDICSKLARACALTSPYTSVRNTENINLPEWRAHSYNVAH
uniref:Taste receptor cell protein 1-like isoform X2 n=1 Tax=Geotrypetes seraphini TaxID=260995 RepID=A0A6P8PLZ2_GEOSA|nr:taste receptor cell protein 1-like isoform X2 [Geotrypetes seraphini]